MKIHSGDRQHLSCLALNKLSLLYYGIYIYKFKDQAQILSILSVYNYVFAYFVIARK